VKIGSQVMRNDPRDQGGRGFFIWLDDDFHGLTLKREENRCRY
jgi:hypothetical protein